MAWGYGIWYQYGMFRQVSRQLCGGLGVRHTAPVRHVQAAGEQAAVWSMSTAVWWSVSTAVGMCVSVSTCVGGLLACAHV